MSNATEITHKQQVKTHSQTSSNGLDRGWLLELVGALVSWQLNEPLIALFALAGKGGLQYYEQYLQSLPQSRRMHHLAMRNAILGSGLLTTIPLVGEATFVQWLAAYLTGALIAWALLMSTGCMHRASLAPVSSRP